jgi:hypothetical protein
MRCRDPSLTGANRNELLDRNALRGEMPGALADSLDISTFGNVTIAMAGWHPVVVEVDLQTMIELPPPSCPVLEAHHEDPFFPRSGDARIRGAAALGAIQELSPSIGMKPPCRDGLCLRGHRAAKNNRPR